MTVSEAITKSGITPSASYTGIETANDFVLAFQTDKSKQSKEADWIVCADHVKEHSGSFAAGECDVCFSHTPISCYVVTRGAEILGYACYNATAPDFFGPTRVLDSEQGKGLGKALLLRCLYALREEGYAYAIIGGVGPVAFYEKCVGAHVIPDSTPGVYKDFLGAIERGIMGTTKD